MLATSQLIETPCLVVDEQLCLSSIFHMTDEELLGNKERRINTYKEVSLMRLFHQSILTDSLGFL